MASLIGDLHLGIWDLLLVLVVAAMALVMAYVYHPRWKAFILSLPIPFSMTVLALGRQVDATNILGMVALIAFTQGVRLLHRNLRVPIFPTILIAATGYILIGLALARIIPVNDRTFWIAWAAVLLLAGVLLVLQPPRIEPGHREELSIWIKLPLIFIITAFLVLIKRSLAGFTTVFPMVGVFAAYEARHSLWTTSRQISIFTPPILTMMAVIRLTQPHLGPHLALLCGWAAYLAIFTPITLHMWRQEDAQQAAQNT
jgi:hypothetical protein